MTSELRKTGIGVVGDIHWGPHFCHFYETKEDLLDILPPYFRTRKPTVISAAGRVIIVKHAGLLSKEV